ncbi:MAG: HAD-IC family P-type ATPase [Oscillatoriales cyanobacterium SM2_1_8]|nr:HAD-IC family P-type ATPase [Oscillatoriales cyanobacterium SM2_1_8]
MRVTRVGTDTTLGQIAAWVNRAQTHKFPIQRLVDRVAGGFAYGVMALALTTLVGWQLAGAPPLTALEYAIAVLVVACPCALGLATPSALAVGTGLAAERGILVANGEVLERIPGLNGVVLDKTGTLTAGRLTVAAVAGDRPDWVLTLAATAERDNPHPIAQAIAAAATPLPGPSPEVAIGQGVRAQVDGDWVAVGSPPLVGVLGGDSGSPVADNPRNLGAIRLYPGVGELAKPNCWGDRPGGSAAAGGQGCGASPASALRRGVDVDGRSPGDGFGPGRRAGHSSGQRAGRGFPNGQSHGGRGAASPGVSGGVCGGWGQRRAGPGHGGCGHRVGLRDGCGGGGGGGGRG